tara:strand:+ start:1981 stop:2517 length:537 start_codon:yes stop_codon:yes gene_type:complete
MANYITILRIFLILPVLILASPESSHLNWMALILFIIAGITDRLDGYVARKTKTESSLGALLDLIADKLLICIVLLWVTFYIGESYLLIPTIIIISRELLVSTIRQFLAETYGKNPIKVSFIAKSKTTLQVIATSLCLISPNFDELFMQIAIFSLWLSALVSIYSLYDYLTAYKIKIK